MQLGYSLKVGFPVPRQGACFPEPGTCMSNLCVGDAALGSSLLCALGQNALPLWNSVYLI